MKTKLWHYLVTTDGRIIGVYGSALDAVAQARSAEIPLARAVSMAGPRLSVGEYLPAVTTDWQSIGAKP